MKTQNVKLLFSAAIVMLMAWALASCSKSDDKVTAADLTGLQASIDTANHYITVGVEGSGEGQYLPGSKATLSSAIAIATTVKGTAGVSQTTVNAAKASLDAAIAAFKAAVVAPIAGSDLVAHWKFDEGSGTTATDASSNHLNGTLMVGTAKAGAGAVPNYVADHKGVAGKALHFADGGHIEVPKNTALVPAYITVSLWINLDSLSTANGVFTNNYILSQNDYHGWKLQTQEAKKPFFTVSATNGIYDRDTKDGIAVPLSLKKWYYLTVTYAEGTEVFYINGTMVKTWTDVSGPLAAITDQDAFNIGQSYSNAYFTANPPDYIPPHYYGSLDEVRIYKTALSAAQVLSLYNSEK